MFRRGLFIPVMLAALSAAAAAVVLSPGLLNFASGPNLTPGPQPAAHSATPDTAAADLDALKPRDGSATSPAFDVARISPDGWSVFAGTAPPNSHVTVTADGEPVGTAQADERGEWSLVTDHEFASKDPILGLSASPGEPAQQMAGAGYRQPEAKAAAGGLDPSASMMQNFESLVAAARDPEQPSRSQAAMHAPLPVPIQFVFREATFTENGRKAMELLLEYLKIKQPESVVLTGHADERGSDSFNLELSRERLDAVVKYLREHGFTGNLVLIPKGSSEPYRGIDRSSLDRETLWQLDRRVELRLDADVPPHRSAQDSGRSNVAK
ncbi:MAG TPA: OmpA family protein [Hyphomicrobiaceae bacterium]